MFQSQPQDPSPQNQRRRQMFLLALFALGVLVLGRMGVLDDGGFLGGGLGNTGADAVRFQPYRSVADLERTLERTGYDLRTVAAAAPAVVPRLFVDRLPEGWAALPAPQRERLFVTVLLPLVLSVNDRMQGLRDRLATIADAPDAGALADAERALVTDVAAALAVPGLTAVRAEQEPLAVATELAERLGPLPVALTIAQAALASDWGRAIMAPAALQDGTPADLFGDGADALSATGPFASPLRVPGSPPVETADLWSALAAQAMTLASSPRFAGFRAERAALEARHAPLDGTALAALLAPGGDAAGILALVEANGLAAYETARLAPPPALVLVARPDDADGAARGGEPEADGGRSG